MDGLRKARASSTSSIPRDTSSLATIGENPPSATSRDTLPGSAVTTVHGIVASGRDDVASGAAVDGVGGIRGGVGEAGVAGSLVMCES